MNVTDILKRGGGSMSEEICVKDNEKTIKEKIFEFMRNEVFTGAPDISYQAAEDFSEGELDSFISTYWDYLMK